MERPQEKEIAIGRETVVATFDTRRLALERQAYLRLQSLLGASCPLPRIIEFRPLGNGRAEIELERIRGRDLAHIFYASRDQKSIERMCGPVVERVLDMLDEWTAIDAGEDKAAFVREAREAIASRAERLRTLPQGLVPRIALEALPHVARRLERLSEESEVVRLAKSLPHLTPSHKDLKTGNIFVEPSGNVRFIDPRFALHWASTVSSGHVMIDWVQFGFNVRRIWDEDHGEQTARIHLAKSVEDRMHLWLMRYETDGSLERVLRDIQTHRYLNSLYHISRLGNRQGDAMRLAEFVAQHVHDAYVVWKPRRTVCSYPRTSSLAAQ